MVIIIYYLTTSMVEVCGIFEVEVINVDLTETTKGESSWLYHTDTEARGHGDRTRLETLVVHAVNDEC